MPDRYVWEQWWHRGERVLWPPTVAAHVTLTAGLYATAQGVRHIYACKLPYFKAWCKGKKNHEYRKLIDSKLVILLKKSTTISLQLLQDAQGASSSLYLVPFCVECDYILLKCISSGQKFKRQFLQLLKGQNSPISYCQHSSNVNVIRIKEEIKGIKEGHMQI